MKRTSAVIFAVLVFMLSSFGSFGQAIASDEVFVLKLDHSDSVASTSTAGLRIWADEIEKASNGRLQIEFYYSSTLGSPLDAYTNLLTGVSDIAWVATLIFSGTWPLYEGGVIPMLGAANNISAGIANWRMFEENEQLQAGFSNAKVLTLFTNECFIIISNGLDPSKLENYNGIRGRTSGSVQSDFVHKLGGSPMSIPVGEVYEAYNKRIVDFVFWNYSGTVAFGLLPDTNYLMTDVVGYAPMAILMNKQKYESLPDDLKKIIDDHSGEHLSKLIASAWFDGGVNAVGRIVEQGVSIVNAEPALVELFNNASEELKVEFIENMRARGLDGEGYLNRLQEIIQITNELYPNNFYEEYVQSQR